MQFDHFNATGTVLPVVAPADDYIAAVLLMTMVAECAAFELKLDTDPLSLAGINLTLGFTIGEPSLHGLNHVSKLSRDHAEKEHYALLVYGFMAKAAKVYRISIGWATIQF